MDLGIDLYTSSVYELRGELRRLMRMFNATPVSAMKRKDLLQHIEIYTKLVGMLAITPKIDAGSGRLPPRPIPTENVIIDNTDISVPQEPKLRAFGKPKSSLHST